MSAYLPRPDLQTLPLPYMIERSRTAAFAVKTAAGAIQRLLDVSLNAAATSAGQRLTQRFKPLFNLDYALFTFIHYPDLHAAQTALPPAQRWGYFDYEEFAVVLLLEDTRASGLGSCWYVPMILLNKCLPLILGREIYGFPKMSGAFDVQPLFGDDWLVGARLGNLRVGVEGFARRDPRLAAQTVPVANVSLKAGLPAPFSTIVHALDPFDLRGFVESLAPPDHFDLAAFRLLKTFVGGLLPGVFLKEFPGVDTVSPAAYRRLLKADFVPTEIRSLSYLLADVTAFDPASYPLASTFGIAPGRAGLASGIFAELSWVLPPPVEM